MELLKNKLNKILILYTELLECTKEENRIIFDGDLGGLPHMFGRKVEAFENILDALPEQLDLFDLMEEALMNHEDGGEEIFLLIESCRWVIREILELSKRTEHYLVGRQKMLEEACAH